MKIFSKISSSKKFFIVAATVWTVVAIIASAILEFVIKGFVDPLSWASNTLILIGITAVGLVFGEALGTDKAKHDSEGLYQTSVKAYNKIRELVDEIIMFFSKFLGWYADINLTEKKINYLIANGMSESKANSIVRYCDNQDYEDLVNHTICKNVNGKDIYIKKLTEEERESVKEVLSGKIKLYSNSSSYYLQAFTPETNKVDLEQANELEKQRKKSLSSKRFKRVAWTIISSVVLGGFVAVELTSLNNAQVWANLITRLVTFFSSMFFGYFGGLEDVKKLAIIINHKSYILTKFKQCYDRKLFECLSEEEEAKREYELFIKQTQEKEPILANESNFL